jgi:hypothetical protein
VPGGCHVAGWLTDSTQLPLSSVEYPYPLPPGRSCEVMSKLVPKWGCDGHEWAGRPPSWAYVVQASVHMFFSGCTWPWWYTI